MSINLECLHGLDAIPNKDVSEDADALNGQVKNYKSYYESLGVPADKIFLSAVVSAAMLSELCATAGFVKIELAKTSGNNEDSTDFTFVISQFTVEEEMLPNPVSKIDEDTQLFSVTVPMALSSKYMSATCCKNPPGTKPAGN